MTKNLNFVLDSVENIVDKGEKKKPAFSPYPIIFSKSFLQRVVKVGIVWGKVKPCRN